MKQTWACVGSVLLNVELDKNLIWSLDEAQTDSIKFKVTQKPLNYACVSTQIFQVSECAQRRGQHFSNPKLWLWRGKHNNNKAYVRKETSLWQQQNHSSTATFPRSRFSRQVWSHQINAHTLYKIEKMSFICSIHTGVFPKNKFRVKTGNQNVLFSMNISPFLKK